MVPTQKPLIVGNWKMQPASRARAVSLVKDVRAKIGKKDDVSVVVAPPFVYLDAVRTALGKNTSIALGVQDVSSEKPGAHTGQIALAMVRDFGVQYSIVGHSERRALGETDAMVNHKLQAIVKEGNIGIVCVGEKERDASGQYLTFLEGQIRSALQGIPKSRLDRIVVAYEPLWAIGTGVVATPADVHEIKLFIVRILSEMYGRTYAQRVRILYGGSVNAKNAQGLFTEGVVNGFLVGGASLKAEEFIGIIQAVR